MMDLLRPNSTTAVRNLLLYIAIYWKKENTSVLVYFTFTGIPFINLLKIRNLATVLDREKPIKPGI
jgi:hypothetical protein